MARKLDQEKRMRIIAAARTAFGSQGFAKTTIKHIANETGIAQGSVYTYFASKEELFDAVVTGIWESFIAGFQKIMSRSSSVEQMFTEFLDFGFDLLGAIHPLLRGMYTEANRRELLREKVDDICRFIEEIFTSSSTPPILFDSLSPTARQFNLNIMVSGVLFRTSLTKPEDLVAEIASLKSGLQRVMRERIEGVHR